ncbi:hypothetical protein JCM3775_000600 [Rhodotorula graminis]
MSSEDEFGDDLAWDDATLEELASLDTRTPAQQRAQPVPAPPPPRASQVPPQRRAQPPPNPPPQHRRAPVLPPHLAPPGPSQLAPGGTQGGASFPGGTQQQQYLGPAPKTGILRPPKPPPRSTQAAAASPAPPPVRTAAPALAAPPAPAPVPKRHPRQSLNAAGEPGFVDPNPFAGRPAAAPPPVAAPAAARARSRTPTVVKAEPEAARGRELGPGHGREAASRDEGDEDLPAIAFDEHGGGGYKAEPQRGTTVAAPGVRGGARAGAPAPAHAHAHSAVVAQQGGAPVSPGPAVAAQDAERRELERLRAEKDQLAQQLALAKKMQQDLERQVMTKTGENSVVRQRLSKAETLHQVALKAEQRDKALLQEQLEQREREYRTQLERFKMEDAFRRQELATAGISGPGSASSQRMYGASSSAHPNHPGLSSARSARFYSRAASAAPSPGPAAGPAPSPSVDRAGGGSARRRSARTASAAPAPAPAPAPSFAGFQSAFGPSTTTSKGAAGGAKPKEKAGGAAERQEGDKEEREGSMGPPRKRAPRTPGGPLESKRRRGEDTTGKGKGRLMLVEEDAFGGEADETDLGGYEHGEALVPNGEAEMGDDEDGEAWAWVPEHRDARGELLAAVFSHTTLAPLDLEPAVIPPSAHPHAHAYSMRRATATGATATATATSSSRFGTSARSTASTYGGRYPSSHAPTSATSSAPSGPVPTFHALMNLRFPSTTPPPLVAEYEILTRELFALLGRRLDPHGHPSSSQSHSTGPTTAAQFALLPPHLALSTRPEDLETALLASDLTRALTKLLGVLERATLVGPMTALLRLLSHLVFLFPHVAHSCCAAATAVAPPDAAAATTTAPSPSSKGEPLVQLLARIVARYARPETATKEHAGGAAAAAAALLARGGGGGVMLRSRKARIARPSAAGSAGAGGGKRRGGRDGAEGEKEGEALVPLEAGKRARLVEGVLGVLEGVAWRCLASRKADEANGEGDGGRAAEEAFMAFLKTANAVATLLDPSQSVGVLLGGARLLALLACRPALFRTLLALKFYESPDIRASKLPLVDRLATLLVMPRAEAPAAHTLDLTLLSLASLLLTAHEDAVMLVAQAASFVPELLAKMWRDVRTLWEWDGREATKGSAARDMLNRTTTRLSATMHLLYYLSLAPHSSLSISYFLAGPTSASATAAGAGAAGSAKDHLAAGPAPAYARQAVNDLFMVALGTVGFATFGAEEGSAQGEDKDGEGEGGMPSWAEEGSEQRRVLCELGYLAQEILEDVSPLELEEIEVCFAPPGDGDGDDGDERMADGEDDGEDERQLAGVEAGV